MSPAKRTTARREIRKLLSRLRREARYERRARRPSVLRPWRGECLVLRAADSRIRGTPITTQKVAPPEAPDAASPSTVQDGPGPAEPALAASSRLSSHRLHPFPVAEEVLIGPDELLRLCAWPDLPDRCSQKDAARLLGVQRFTIANWCRQGLLVRRRPERPSRGMPWCVAYPPTDLMVRFVTGKKLVMPESFLRRFASEPALQWAADLFRRQARRERLVRVSRNRTAPGRHAGARWHWICPACGRTCYLLYLPTGPMVRWGRHWRPWRFLCQNCAGVLHEGTAYGRVGSGLNRWTLRWTLGRAGKYEDAPDGQGRYVLEWEEWIAGRGPPPPLVP